MKIELCHAGTCLPDYWRGHHRLHLSIPVYHGMPQQEIKSALINELDRDAFCGSDSLADALRLGDDATYQACRTAINELEPNDPTQKNFFLDLEETEEDDYHDQVCAYFVFVEL